jgi:predicted RNA-binding protein YlqC (UPF0109 family)
MIASFQYYFPNVVDGINQKHLNILPKTEIQTNTKFETATKIETVTKIEMMIEDKYLGKIIGRGGRMIDQIRTDSNTKIAVYRELHNTKRKVIITGKRDCIQKAKTNILQLCY